MTRGNAELASFLRTRRERTDPESLGFPAGGRRRTPGLRREEVAALANVGVTWYTWLEQGRDIHPSRQVLASIANALRLGEQERDHMLRLAGHAVAAPLSDKNASDDRALQLVLDRLAPYPASVLDAAWRVVAFNRSYRFMVGDLLQIPAEDRNCLKLMFLNDEWAAMYADLDLARRRAVMRMRAMLGANIDDDGLRALLEELQARSPEFTALWEQGEVGVEAYPVKLLRSARVGALRLRFATMHLSDATGRRLVVMPPEDAVTESRLHALDEFAAAQEAEEAFAADLASEVGGSIAADAAEERGSAAA